MGACFKARQKGVVFLPSHFRPYLPFEDSPEGGANLRLRGANLRSTTVPIDSDFHGDFSKIWAPGIDRGFSSLLYMMS